MNGTRFTYEKIAAALRDAEATSVVGLAGRAFWSSRCTVGASSFLACKPRIFES